MRFWYEGLLRKYGQYACLPLEGQGCRGEQLCEACRLFGATDRARRFRLDLSGLAPTPVFFRLSKAVRPISGNWLWNIFGGEDTGGCKTGAGRDVRFRFAVQALWSSQPFTLTLRVRPHEARSVLSKLSFLIDTMSREGGIGAKTQHGFGQIAILGTAEDGRSPTDWGELCAQGKRDLGGMESSARRLEERDLFTLDASRFFSLKFRLTAHPYAAAENAGDPPAGYDQSYIPCSFDIRYKYESKNPFSGQGMNRGMRPALREEYGRDRTALMCGQVEGSDAWASRIHVSHLFRVQPKGPYYLKIWGDVENAVGVAEVIASHILGRFRGAQQVPEVGQ